MSHTEAVCAFCGDVFPFLNAGSIIVFGSWRKRHGENCPAARREAP